MRNALARLITMVVALWVASSAVVQAQTQLDVLQDVTAICGDHTVLVDDWDTALTGWSPVANPSDHDIQTYIVNHEIALLTIGGLPGLDGYSAFQTTERVVEFAGEFERKIRYFDEARAEGRYRFYTHPNGWFLVVDVAEFYLFASTCALWHPTPDVALLTYLDTPYFDVKPLPAFLGQAMFSKWNIADIVDGATFEVYIYQPTAPGLQVITQLPEAHPLHLTAPVYLELTLSAFSRDP